MTGDKMTAVDPTEALNGAGQLTTIGDQVLSQWRSITKRIHDLNAKQPWGNDEVGKKFNKNYCEGGNDSQVTHVLGAGDDMVTALAELGEQIKDGVRGTEDVDQLIAQWFGKK